MSHAGSCAPCTYARKRPCAYTTTWNRSYRWPCIGAPFPSPTSISTRPRAFYARSWKRKACPKAISASWATARRFGSTNSGVDLGVAQGQAPGSRFRPGRGAEPRGLRRQPSGQSEPEAAEGGYPKVVARSPLLPQPGSDPQTAPRPFRGQGGVAADDGAVPAAARREFPAQFPFRPDLPGQEAIPAQAAALPVIRVAAAQFATQFPPL